MPIEIKLFSGIICLFLGIGGFALALCLIFVLTEVINAVIYDIIAASQRSPLYINRSLAMWKNLTGQLRLSVDDIILTQSSTNVIKFERKRK